MTSNLIIESDGRDQAKARSNVIVFQGTAEFALRPIIASSYRDRFQRVDGGWRFAERRIGLEVADILGDLSAHLTGTDHLAEAPGK